MVTPLEEPLKQTTHRPNRRLAGFWKRTGVVVTSIATAVGMTLGAAMPAAAAPTDDSEALAKFLGGQALGTDLDNIAEIQGALAETPVVSTLALRIH